MFRQRFFPPALTDDFNQRPIISLAYVTEDRPIGNVPRRCGQRLENGIRRPFR